MNSKHKMPVVAQPAPPARFACPDCKCTHGMFPLEHFPPVPCGFDEKRPCDSCGLPVMSLSTSGSRFCPWCANGSPRPEVLWQRWKERCILLGLGEPEHIPGGGYPAGFYESVKEQEYVRNWARMRDHKEAKG